MHAPTRSVRSPSSAYLSSSPFSQSARAPRVCTCVQALLSQGCFQAVSCCLRPRKHIHNPRGLTWHGADGLTTPTKAGPLSALTGREQPWARLEAQ